jgi:hypothetical protein
MTKSGICSIRQAGILKTSNEGRFAGWRQDAMNIYATTQNLELSLQSVIFIDTKQGPALRQKMI